MDQDAVDTATSAGEYVTIVQTFDGKSIDSFVWVSFAPALTTVVSWDSGPKLFISSSDAEAGASVVMDEDSMIDVDYGSTYNYVSDGGFGSLGSMGSMDSAITLMNEGASATFGLAQSVTVGGSTSLVPVCATVVAEDDSTNFLPDDYRVFLSTYATTGVVIDTIPSNAVILEPISSDTALSVTYNDGTGKFKET